MNTAHLSTASLRRENRVISDSGRRSGQSCVERFESAFVDTETHAVIPSCYSDGGRTSVHLIAGRPDEMVVARNSLCGMAAVKQAVTAGSIRQRGSYARAQAVRCVTVAGP